jgi:cytidylate kinase
MIPHTYLEQGLSVLHARLRTPRSPSSHGYHLDEPPFVTLSRETGAGATTLGRELVPLLDREFHHDDSPWVLLDRDLLDQALKHHRLPANLAEYLPEDRVSEIRATIGEIVGLHPSLWQLEQKVAEAVLQLAHVGYVVLAGRAAHLITRSLSGGLHVRLVASLGTRIERTADALRCSRDQAARHVEQQDEARRRFVRANFDADINDPHLYDLVLNTDRLPARAAAELVVTALRERSSRPHAVAIQPTIAK